MTQDQRREQYIRGTANMLDTGVLIHGGNSRQVADDLRYLLSSLERARQEADELEAAYKRLGARLIALEAQNRALLIIVQRVAEEFVGDAGTPDGSITRETARMARRFLAKEVEL